MYREQTEWPRTRSVIFYSMRIRSQQKSSNRISFKLLLSFTVIFTVHFGTYLDVDKESQSHLISVKIIACNLDLHFQDETFEIVRILR